MTQLVRMNDQGFSPELLDLYDGYAHGMISKREFLEGGDKVASDGASASELLGLMQPNYALAQRVGFDDPDIRAEWMTFPSPAGHGEVRGYMVRPTGTNPAPGVVVAHQNSGLNPYIRDVARRLAKGGFIALAPDGLTPMGGYPGNDDEARAMQRRVDRDKQLNDFFAAIEFLLDHDDVTGKVGIAGFSHGGGVANAAAAAYPELGAAVSFYGRQPDPAEVPWIQSPVLLHYAGLDERVNDGWPAFRSALDAYGRVYEAHVYDGVGHGFHNDSTPRFDEKAADLAWDRTLDWLHRHLG